MFPSKAITPLFKTIKLGSSSSSRWFPTCSFTFSLPLPYRSSLNQKYQRHFKSIVSRSWPITTTSIWGGTSSSSKGMEDREERETKKDEVYNKTISSTWNISGLKEEVNRQILRCHKKISKVSLRIQTAQSTIQHLRTNPNVTQEELEACPNIIPIEIELQELQQRLNKFNQVNQALQQQVHVPAKNQPMILPLEIAQVVIDLQCKDTPPPRPNPTSTIRERKEKGPSVSQVQRRKPYKRYYSFNQIEIRVGKQAEDNDELSCNPQHRDNADGWMHASGCPGSHVVIKCTDTNIDPEVILDAASLAARHSKCTGPIIKVTFTRCRNVKKPSFGAKPGLVQLSGSIQTIVVDMNKVQSRLLRLDETCLVN